MEILEGREIWQFWARWSVATVVGWVGGFFVAIVLSYAVVNLFYPKETNLIVGLCLGATVSYSQRFAVRRWVRLPMRFVWGAAVGIGIPFVASVILTEAGTPAGDDASVALLAAGSLVCGLLQMRALRGLVDRPWLWAAAAFVLWTAAWLISRVPSTYALLGATALHGVASGGVLLWLMDHRRDTGRRSQ